MSDCFVQSNHAPASSMQIFAPAFASTCAATPPPAPEPTITTSYVFGLAFTCAMFCSVRNIYNIGLAICLPDIAREPPCQRPESERWQGKCGELPVLNFANNIPACRNAAFA